MYKTMYLTNTVNLASVHCGINTKYVIVSGFCKSGLTYSLPIYIQGTGTIYTYSILSSFGEPVESAVPKLTFISVLVLVLI